ALSAAWEGLASVWLESIAHDDDGSAMAGFRDAGSLEGGLQVARALDGRASSEQLSTFLLQLAAMRGIDGTTPLGPSSVIDAFELACQFGNPAVLDEPGACTGLLLAVAGSSRRTATVPAADWRVESAFTFACGALGQLVATGHADAAVVADALLQAELAAPAPPIPVERHHFRIPRRRSAAGRARDEYVVQPSRGLPCDGKPGGTPASSLRGDRLRQRGSYRPSDCPGGMGRRPVRRVSVQAAEELDADAQGSAARIRPTARTCEMGAGLATARLSLGLAPADPPHARCHAGASDVGRCRDRRPGPRRGAARTH